jgi:hypothetical protein
MHIFPRAQVPGLDELAILLNPLLFVSRPPTVFRVEDKPVSLACLCDGSRLYVTEPHHVLVRIVVAQQGHRCDERVALFLLLDHKGKGPPPVRAISVVYSVVHEVLSGSICQ